MEQENQWHLEDLTAMGKPEGVSTKMIAFLTRKGKLYVLVDAMQCNATLYLYEQEANCDRSGLCSCSLHTM